MGQVVINPGTILVPGLNIQGDSDTGITGPAANELGLVTGGVERMRVGSAGAVYIGDTANANNTAGLTVNQGAADNEASSLKSSDIAHGVTDYAETDTYRFERKRDAAAGGVEYAGLVSSGDQAIVFQGVAITPTSVRTTGASSVIVLTASQKSGTGRASVGANTNLVTITDYGTVRFIFDSDGDSHQDVGTAWTNFDDHDDLALMDSLRVTLRRPDALRTAFSDDLVARRQMLDALPGKKIVQFNEDGHHFVNMSRLAMLHHGAILQVGDSVGKLRERILALERQLPPHIQKQLRETA